MTLKSRQEAEQYVLDKLRSIYSGFGASIQMDTTFDQLERAVDSDFVGAHLFIDMETDLDIEITDDEAVNLNSGSVRDVVDYIVSKLGIQ